MSVENDYDIWASQYDSNDNKTRDLDSKSTIQTLNKYDFSNVVELGCGTGKNTRYLLQKAKKIIAIDFSEEMLRKAKAKITDDKIQFQKADITKKWSIKDGFADLITCSLVLEHIMDFDFVFKQANKKLTQDGLFYVCELHPAKQYFGSKARYNSENGMRELETYVHHVSEYLLTAQNNGFKLIELNEWFDEPPKNEIPRLISFVFQKRE